MTKPVIIAATGHRPNKLGGFNKATDARLFRLAQWFFKGMRPDYVISGMAMGWDMAFAEAAIAARIPVVAALPFPEQAVRWPQSAIDRHNEILRRAVHVELVRPAYSPSALQKRNEWMVDQSDRIVALWDGSGGGTGNCIRYALGKAPIDNLWPVWQQEKF